jgi:hypothetical protein
VGGDSNMLLREEPNGSWKRMIADTEACARWLTEKTSFTSQIPEAAQRLAEAGISSFLLR